MNDLGMDPRRLELLLELSRLGSMREVGESMHVTTSTVSQQIAALAQEAGTPLTEPHGRRVRLTPAGQRLAGHAVTILAAIEAARLDLDPTAVPTGTVRVAAFATAVRESVLPVVRLLAERHPAVLLVIHEHEPDEALGLLADDSVDLALTYDYNLAPARFDRSLVTQPLGLRQWGLGTPSAQGRVAGTALEVFRRFADQDWIVNSRNSGDEEVIRTVASLAGFQPRITHRVDSLELVQDMILAGLGVGLLPDGRPARRGVALRTLGQPDVTQRPFAVTRRGRSAWPPLALVLRLLGEISGLTAPPINLATRWIPRPGEQPELLLRCAEEAADGCEPCLGVVELSHVRCIRDLRERACRKRGVQLPSETHWERHLPTALQNQDRPRPLPQHALGVVWRTRPKLASGIRGVPVAAEPDPGQYLVPVIETVQLPDIAGRARVRHSSAKRAVRGIRTGEHGIIPRNLRTQRRPGLVVGGCFSLLLVILVRSGGR